MIFDRIVANVAEHDDAALSVDDWVDMHWHECIARAARLRTRGGQEIRCLLPLGVQLRHGDLISDGKREIAVAVRPCDVLLLQPRETSTALLLALGLGNLHAPVQIQGEHFIVLPDGPVEELANSLGVAWTTEVRRFEPTPIAAPMRAQLASQFQVVARAAAE
jgi:urease accessory protein UreE